MRSKALAPLRTWPSRAGSSNFSRAYNEAFDLTKLWEFVRLITEISGTLGVEPISGPS
jgi:hypothetical protein